MKRFSLVFWLAVMLSVLLVPNKASAITYATPTPTASSVPKSDSSGHLNPGWLASLGSGGFFYCTSGGVCSFTSAITGSGTNYYLPVWTSSGTLGALAGVGTAGQVLTSNGAGVAPSFHSVKGFVLLGFPSVCDGVGAVIQVSPQQNYNGQARYSNSANVSGNYVEYRLIVPLDMDSGTDLKIESFAFRLGGTDTGNHRYIISCASSAPSTSGTLGSSVNLDFPGDPSGASGDMEYITNVVLTGWKTVLSPGQQWVIRVARSGDDATNDSSTVDSFGGPIMISYGKVQ